MSVPIFGYKFILLLVMHWSTALLLSFSLRKVPTKSLYMCVSCYTVVGFRYKFGYKAFNDTKIQLTVTIQTVEQAHSTARVYKSCLVFIITLFLYTHAVKRLGHRS